MKKRLDHCLRIELSELLPILFAADIPVPPTLDDPYQGVHLMTFSSHPSKGEKVDSSAHLEIYWSSEIDLTETE